jgi:hypothetical protein
MAQYKDRESSLGAARVCKPRIQDPAGAEEATSAWLVKEGHKHLCGEWFTCDRDAAVRMVKRMAGVE